ncbi:hypothetical protein GCM10009867_05070 [Pedococcus aerophilus]|uniref:DUF305 domain-containing protein n=1 Tax=Pedococcus aerophilus TaxID=436356 RepID=A0ABN3UFE0_9MICO|nr:DUF305 domain-containing protein [Phycicoccus sp. Root563]KQZ88467.1 hypothetical protein ASD62_03190 [Phycicoccus sp. Root563]
MKRLFSALALAVVAALALTGCGNAADTTASGSNNSSSSSSKADFNDADVKFTQSMIPHHEQAVVMAKMAATHAQSAQVKDLAAKIEAAQRPEIDTMSGWLKAWGQEQPSRGGMGMSGMDHGSDGMAGMMSDDDMRSLDSAKGTSFDQMFLTMMISHHEGAIEMAKTQQADGKNADAVALAKKIEADQTAELAQMKDMLKS